MSGRPWSDILNKSAIVSQFVENHSKSKRGSCLVGASVARLAQRTAAPHRFGDRDGLGIGSTLLSVALGRHKVILVEVARAVLARLGRAITAIATVVVLSPTARGLIAE